MTLRVGAEVVEPGKARGKSPRQAVAIVASAYRPEPGGVERYVQRLAEGLVERGVAVEVITPAASDRQSTETIRGVAVRRFRTRSPGIPSLFMIQWLLANSARYALINAHNLHSTLPAMAAGVSARTGVPLVLTPYWHGTGHTATRKLLHVPYRPVAMWTIRAADALICNSNAERNMLVEQFRIRCPLSVIPPGVDIPVEDRPGRPRTDRVREQLDGPRILLTVGRLEPYKRTLAIVESLPFLPDWQLVIVGSGPARDAVLSAAESGGVAERVRMIGRCSDDELRDLYSQAAAYISLSSHESFGLTVLEAAAAGCPVVASDIAAHRELATFAPDNRFFFIKPDARAVDVASTISSAIAAGRVSPAEEANGSLPTWSGLADQVLAVYESVAQSAIR